MHFGENQLSPGSIGISPLSTGHPPLLQQRWVRASTGSHPRFTLPMESSPGFGPDPGNALAPFRLAFAPAPRLCPPLNPPGPAGPRRCRDQLAGSFYKRHAVTRPRGPEGPAGPCPDCSRAQGFRVSFIPLAGCFSPFPHGTRALSVARRMWPWRVVPPASRRVSRAPRYSGSAPPVARVRPSATGLSPAAARLPSRFAWPIAPHRLCGAALQPRRPRPRGRAAVWAPPGSLAATAGISLDFSSSGY